MENAKSELEGGCERGINTERDSKKQDRLEEKLRLRGQGKENKNILGFYLITDWIKIETQASIQL